MIEQFDSLYVRITDNQPAATALCHGILKHMQAEFDAAIAGVPGANINGSWRIPGSGWSSGPGYFEGWFEAKHRKWVEEILASFEENNDHYLIDT